MSNSENSAEINQVEVLDRLIEQVRAAHGAVQKAESLTLDSAMDAGDALLAIQERITIPMKRFMAKTMPDIGDSTWKLYMQLARHRAKIMAAQDVLSIREARQLIAKKKPTKPKSAPSELVTLLNKTADAEVTAAFVAKGFDWFLRVIPAAFRPLLETRAGGQVLSRLKQQHPKARLKNVDLKLVHSADQPTTHH
jgi:hypothetical protein